MLTRLGVARAALGAMAIIGAATAAAFGQSLAADRLEASMLIAGAAPPFGFGSMPASSSAVIARIDVPLSSRSPGRSAASR